MIRELMAPLLDTKNLNLIILPTEDCNVRYTYCYEDYASGEMRPEFVASIKKLIDSRIERLDDLRLSWFGGEPLIAKHIVLELSAYAQKTAMLQGCGFSSDMTTNGYTLNLRTFEKGTMSAPCIPDIAERRGRRTRPNQKIYFGKAFIRKNLGQPSRTEAA